MMRAWSIAVVLVQVLAACGDEAPAEVEGAPTLKAKPKKETPKPVAKAAADPSETVELARRDTVVLDARSFNRRRDPFQSVFQSAVAMPESESKKAVREVKLAKYSFDELKLVTVTITGPSMPPIALFLASDGKSQTIRQGEYFSSAEVLLAAVNRDYIEIEVVDEELASSLNMRRGERRAIYLHTQ